MERSLPRPSTANSAVKLRAPSGAKLRALEPNGLLKLAAAQIHEEQWDHANATVKQLNQKQWPERFRQVEAEIRRLQALLPVGTLEILQ